MKLISKSILASVIFLVCSSHSAETMDSQMSALATNLSKDIQSSERKKVAVLDFTDLQGRLSELGRFIAEELTVNLVSSRKNFSVVDRG